MFKNLKEPLHQLVDARYASARSSESLTFAPSSLDVLRTKHGLPFQLRYCPSLAKKPLPNRETEDTPKPKKKTNPFENPDPALFIVDAPPGSANPTHYLVLNKFPIIASHFILATKVNKAQTAMLEQDDVSAAYECLRAWESGPGNRSLYGFFNSGEHSGASQAHRHLQFVPVEGMREGDDRNEWNPLIEKIVHTGINVPFQVFWEEIKDDMKGEQIYAAYQRLYASAFQAVKDYNASNPNGLELHDTTNDASPFSYNLGMTSSALMIIPRRKEGSALHSSDGPEGQTEIGYAAFNGTVLAGTMMVKSQDEWDLLRENGSLLDELLEEIGIPSDPNVGGRERSEPRSTRI